MNPSQPIFDATVILFSFRLSKFICICEYVHVSVFSLSQNNSQIHISLDTRNGKITRLNRFKKIARHKNGTITTEKFEITRIFMYVSIPRDFEFQRNLYLQFPPFWIQISQKFLESSMKIFNTLWNSTPKNRYQL